MYTDIDQNVPLFLTGKKKNGNFLNACENAF